jgi:hypothetical protein
VSEEHNCQRCNAPFLYFTGGNRNFQCCSYASNLQDRIKRLEEAGDRMASTHLEKPSYESALYDVCAWHKAKEAKPCIKQLKTKSCIYCMKVECECSDFDVSADMGAKG